MAHLGWGGGEWEASVGHEKEIQSKFQVRRVRQVGLFSKQICRTYVVRNPPTNPSAHRARVQMRSQSPKSATQTAWPKYVQALCRSLFAARSVVGWGPNNCKKANINSMWLDNFVVAYVLWPICLVPVAGHWSRCPCALFRAHLQIKTHRSQVPRHTNLGLRRASHCPTAAVSERYGNRGASATQRNQNNGWISISLGPTHAPSNSTQNSDEGRLTPLVATSAGEELRLKNNINKSTWQCAFDFRFS